MSHKKIEITYDELWIVREAMSKRIEEFREHITYMGECAKEIEAGGAVPMIGKGEHGARVLRDIVENFEAQIRKHQWLLDYRFNPDEDDENYYVDESDEEDA